MSNFFKNYFFKNYFIKDGEIQADYEVIEAKESQNCGLSICRPFKHSLYCSEGHKNKGSLKATLQASAVPAQDGSSPHPFSASFWG